MVIPKKPPLEKSKVNSPSAYSLTVDRDLFDRSIFCESSSFLQQVMNTAAQNRIKYKERIKGIFANGGSNRVFVIGILNIIKYKMSAIAGNIFFAKSNAMRLYTTFIECPLYYRLFILATKIYSRYDYLKSYSIHIPNVDGLFAYSTFIDTSNGDRFYNSSVELVIYLMTI